MNPDQLQRRLARIHDTSPESITRTDMEAGISFDFQYDTYQTTRVQSSVVFNPDENVFTELRVRLPEVPNNASSGTEAREIQRFLADHLGRAVDRFTGGITPADIYPRVEIAPSGFVMHIEARHISVEQAFSLMQFLKTDYEPPDISSHDF